MAIYAQRSDRLEQLDGRTTSYRFDLETAPCWSRVNEPGHHAPRTFLEDLGVDVSRLGQHIATFDWVYAGAVCRLFVALEEFIIRFVRAERGRLPPSKSLDALVEEEEKHVLLFKRYEELLLARRDRAAFERAYAAMGERMARRHARLLDVPEDLDRHYLAWINAIFFEEVTVYLDQRLSRDGEAVQPLWRSIHRLHRVEEMQHLATDDAHVAELAISDARKRELSLGFTMGILQNYEDTMALSPSLAHAQELGVDGIYTRGRISERPFFRQLLVSSTFKRTRAAAPYLRELASRLQPQSTPAEAE
jgi:hypothetical protein